MQTDLYADKQEVLIENKFESFQNVKSESYQFVNQENKQYFSLSDSGLSSVLGIFTPDANNKEDEQIPVKRKKRSRSGGSGSREVATEFISRTHAGYFRL